MSKYLSFFKLRVAVGLQYRFSAIAGLATQFFWGLMLLFLYEAFYKNGISTPFEWKGLVSYIWLGQAFYAIVFFRLITPDIFDSIKTGQISYEMIRPLNIYWMWFAKICAQRVSACLLRLAPVIIFAAILPSHYALGLPASFGGFILFWITLILGMFISTALAMLVYIFMFYTTSCTGLFNAYAAFAIFLSGMDIPIKFMPELFQNICYALPFRLCMDLPMRLYIGDITITEGMVSVLLQITWIIGLVHLGNHLIQRVSKKVVVQGG
jgi:ABC-2 type transport system permease protein